ncbi:MAG TPA: hypothetical protein DEG88_11405 [Propionibacteriaceae bacterium]|nr:hypothetical protein [Propionibacteriaceae bacterium]HBY23846.1 hypothetical protein [Propionibacteriaceae bacterium]
MSDNPDLSSRLAELAPKQKQPNSAAVLNNWIARAERGFGVDGGGRLGWLVASTILTAALQRAVAADGQSRFLLKIVDEDLTPGPSAALRHAATIHNPGFYEAQRACRSTWNIPRFVQGFDGAFNGDLAWSHKSRT